MNHYVNFSRVTGRPEIDLIRVIIGTLVQVVPVSRLLTGFRNTPASFSLLGGGNGSGTCYLIEIYLCSSFGALYNGREDNRDIEIATRYSRGLLA